MIKKFFLGVVFGAFGFICLLYLVPFFIGLFMSIIFNDITILYKCLHVFDKPDGLFFALVKGWAWLMAIVAFFSGYCVVNNDYKY